jgi:hypothetical protein
MLQRGSRILIDTNAIAGAHRVGCWNAIRNFFRLETADFCIEEAVRKDRYGRQLVNRSAEDLKAELKAHAVSDLHRVTLDLALQGQVDLDAGEYDLLSLAFSLKGEVWWLCGPDKATLRAMHILALLDNMCSLELLARTAGARVGSWEEQYTDIWLSKKRTLLLLGRDIHS